jgi:hypothetical protein
VGFAVTSARSLLRSRYLLIGAALTLALAAPDLIWQAAHGWPAFQVFHQLQTAAGHNRATYWIAQVLFTGPVLAPVWVAGLVWAVRGQAGRLFRPVGLACVIVIVLQFVLGGKPYYSGGAYTFALAAGAVATERRLAGRKAAGSRFGPAQRLGAAMLLGGVIAAPVTLAVLPARTLHSLPLQKINYDLGEEIAWPKLVSQIAAEYHALPATQRAHTTILTSNYGEAGAIDRYGPGLGLPQVYSGANNFWLWGPPPAADTSAIVVSLDPSFLRHEFAHVRLIGTFWNGMGVSDDEQGARIYLATGLKGSWAQDWLAFRNYS